MTYELPGNAPLASSGGPMRMDAGLRRYLDCGVDFLVPFSFVGRENTFHSFGRFGKSNLIAICCSRGAEGFRGPRCDAYSLIPLRQPLIDFFKASSGAPFFITGIHVWILTSSLANLKNFPHNFTIPRNSTLPLSSSSRPKLTLPRC